MALIDLLHDTRHLCARLGTDEIKAMSRGFSGGKRGIKSANIRNREIASFIHCLPPEKPRDIANIPSILRLRANGRNIVGCYMSRLFAHPVACCWMLLRVVAQSLKSVKLFISQQLPTFLFCSVIAEA